MKTKHISKQSFWKLIGVEYNCIRKFKFSRNDISQKISANVEINVIAFVARAQTDTDVVTLNECTKQVTCFKGSYRAIPYDIKVLFSKSDKLVTQFGTMCLKCGQDVWNIYAWPKLSSDIVSHSLQGSSFHFRSWAQYWLISGSCSVRGLDERTPVKDNTSVLA